MTDIEDLIKKAEAGDQNAQWILGGIYYQGNGVEKDLKKAIEWCNKANAQGYPDTKENSNIAFGEIDEMIEHYEKENEK